MLKPPEEHTTGSDEVPLGLVACCVGVEVPAAMYRREEPALRTSQTRR